MYTKKPRGRLFPLHLKYIEFIIFEINVPRWISVLMRPLMGICGRSNQWRSPRGKQTPEQSHLRPPWPPSPRCPYTVGCRTWKRRGERRKVIVSIIIKQLHTCFWCGVICFQHYTTVISDQVIWLDERHSTSADKDLLAWLHLLSITAMGLLTLTLYMYHNVIVVARYNV